MTKEEIEDVLDAIASRAKALVDGGVRALSVDGISITLAPPDVAPIAPSQPQPAQPDRVDPSHDPVTYGLPAGAKVPGIDWGDHKDAQARRHRELGLQKG